MKKIFLFLLISFLPIYSKKKVVIFTSKGGAAQTSATEVIQVLLAPFYEVIAVNLLDEVLIELDPIKFFSNSTCETFYNYLAKSGWYWTINKVSNFGLRQFKNKSKKITELLVNYLKKMNPDLLISVTPVINSPICDAAKQLQIPFVVDFIDFDLGYYFSNKVDYSKLYLFAPSKDVVNFTNVPKIKINYVGFPLRKSFYQKKDKEQIRKDFSLPDKPTVLIMGGGAGSKRSFYFVKKLAQSKKPLHIIVCAGRNDFLKKKVEKLKVPKHITVSAIGFTEKIADLMAVSDVLITKSGPTSFIEAVQMELPILIDGTSTFIKWEKINAQLVEKYKVGVVIKNYAYTLKEVEKILFDAEYKKTLKNNLKSFKSTLPNFNLCFPKLIKQII